MNTNKTPTASQSEKSDVATREEAILAFWQEHDIFKKSVEKEAEHGDYVFYDGPPFATGLPHYGHILAGTIKDAIPRFFAMQGYRVRRKWGWDCHGLPLENIIEKRLGLATKRDIEELGIKTFNEAARGAVLEYADDWKRIIPRMGRFVDMENDYKTMDPSYTESVWWVFSELYKKGLVYEGFKSMHLCPRCGTTLSNFEVNQGYKDIKDISVFVALPLVDEPDVSLLVWTTTPWTLPGNMAAAVHEEYEYVVASYKTKEGEERKYIVAKDRANAVFGEGAYSVQKTLRGKELVGKRYTPPFSYYTNREFEGKENAWQILHAEYVELGEEGTGAVHLAPAYGEEDMVLAEKFGVPVVHHVGEDGKFMDHITDFKGKLVKPKDDEGSDVSHLDTDIEIVRALNERGVLLKKENITHSYPHCWRCDTPLLNYATSSWFVRVTDIKDTLVEENEKVHWVPEHVGRARFGKWLEGARDWAVSRSRYWGAPLPIWRNPETKEIRVMGSLEDIRKYVKRSENTYYLVRHGESESNAKNISSTDIAEANSLTAEGIRQIDDALPGLKEKGIDCIIASPYQRTRETAERIAEGLGLDVSEIVFDERIGEIQLGEFDGKDISLYHDFLESGAKWCDCAPVGGESWVDVKRRVGEFLYDIDERYQGKRILIVSHNSPLRMLGAVNDGLSLETNAFDHDVDGKRYQNAEVRELPFVPMPHNDEFELDYHRPYIDEFPLSDTDGTRLERVEEVFDCWFESGSMPYGQHHYPFEHADTFEKELFPANFIAEGLDQTRGWFYSLIVLGTALFGKSPYQNVIVNGLVLAEDGKKMSKKLQNYPDPMELADRVGVDAIRFYLLSSSIIKGEDLNFSEKEVLELQRKNIGRLHNVLSMYEMYATDTEATADSTHILDRWIRMRLYELITEVTEGFTHYELDRATRPITDFIDDLSIWYVRRSRDRFKSGDKSDAHAALKTLRYVLRKLALVMAPSMPFYAEYLFQHVRLQEDPESVHLCDWPEGEKIDEDVISHMAETRNVVSEALEVRSRLGIKVRQPLAALILNTQSAVLKDPYVSLIMDEVNVKAVRCDTRESQSVSLDTDITPELKAEGLARECIRAIQELRKKAGLQPADRITVTADVPPELQEALTTFSDDVQSVTGSDSLTFSAVEGEEVRVGDHVARFLVEKI